MPVLMPPGGEQVLVKDEITHLKISDEQIFHMDSGKYVIDKIFLSGPDLDREVLITMQIRRRQIDPDEEIKEKEEIND